MARRANLPRDLATLRLLAEIGACAAGIRANLGDPNHDPKAALFETLLVRVEQAAEKVDAFLDMAPAKEATKRRAKPVEEVAKQMDKLKSRLESNDLVQ